MGQDKKGIQKDINTKRLDLKLGNQQGVGLGSSEKTGQVEGFLCVQALPQCGGMVLLCHDFSLCASIYPP